MEDGLGLHPHRPVPSNTISRRPTHLNLRCRAGTPGLHKIISKQTLFRKLPRGFILSAQDMTLLHLYTLIIIGASILVTAYLLFRRKPKTAAEIEKGRRAFLEQVGRITDGTVIDVQEIGPDALKSSTLLVYQYDVAGVSYEASQDVTYLRPWINLHACRLGLPTSVRYDPLNPGNSMVVSEKWMGLRQ